MANIFLKIFNLSLSDPWPNFLCCLPSGVFCCLFFTVYTVRSKAVTRYHLFIYGVAMVWVYLALLCGTIWLYCVGLSGFMVWGYLALLCGSIRLYGVGLSGFFLGYKTIWLYCVGLLALWCGTIWKTKCLFKQSQILWRIYF